MSKINMHKRKCSFGLLFLYVLIFPLYSQAQEIEKQKVKHGFIIKSGNYKPAPPSGESRLGKALVKKNNCLMCHSIGGEGGCLSPPFDGIGAHRSREFILSRITASAAAEKEFAKLYGQPELMPHLRIPPKEASLVSQYLLTLPAPKDGFFVAAHHVNLNPQQSVLVDQGAQHESNLQTIADGKKLVYKNGCTACHSIYGIGGHFAPPFDNLSKHRTEDYVRQRITNVEFFTQNNPDEYDSRGTVMPPSNLTVQEIDKICQFLMSL